VRRKTMGKVRNDSCPKCKTGKITLDRDFYGWYEYCVQCGYVRDLPDLPRYYKDGVKAHHQTRR
jgi:uncharacterized protein (DUF983 family)